MLSPPPEGSFDVEDANLPIKVPNKERLPSHPSGSSAEQVPLLATNVAPADSSSSNKEKVRDVLCLDYLRLYS